MNLNYDLSDIAKWINAEIIGDTEGTVNHISIDSRSPLNKNTTLFIALPGQKNHGHDFIPDFVHKQGNMVVVEKRQNIENCIQLVVKNSVEALQIIAAKHRQNFSIPVIAITGSNGKTTVKEWLFHILKEHFSVIRSPKSYNSQIGVALSVLEISNSHQIAIIEAGISMPGEMVKLEKIIKPTIGIYTGIGSAHESNFKSVKQKEDEKMLLFKDVKEFFTPLNINLVQRSQIPFNNPASITNASLVKETAMFLGLPENEVQASLLSLPHISMRMEQMAGAHGNILINDTYTFDEKGLEIALNSISQGGWSLKRVVILAPDDSYHAKSLKAILQAGRIDTLVWISSRKIPFELKANIIHYNSVQNFIEQALDISHSIILFSGSRSAQLERSIPLYQLKKHVTQLEINLDAIRHNLYFYKTKMSQKTKVLAMVKAQSYGSGSVEMARFLAQEKVDALGVAYADEGVALKKDGIELPILIMNPEQAAFDDIIDYALEPSIYGLGILDKFLNQLIIRGKHRVPIHIKLDTGMHRLGFMPNELNELISTLNAQPEVFVKGVFSHLSEASNVKDPEFTNKQISVFKDMCSQLEIGIGYSFTKHLSNTDGIINYPEAQFDMVRIGIGLFGLASTLDPILRSALSFKTQISQIKKVDSGQSVGYGRSFIATEKTTIAIIPVGYADGLSRSLSNGNWSMKLNEQFAPIIGSVCMDMCMLNVTGLHCSEGDEVEIFGWENSIKNMSSKLKTIPYEIISSISSRVHRVYIEG